MSDGVSWTKELETDTLLTSGYTSLVRTGPGSFLWAIDAAPPQAGCGGTACDPRCAPMGEAFWTGVRDVAVTGLKSDDEQLIDTASTGAFPYQQSVMRASKM